MPGGQVLWGQGKYRSRSGSVRKAFSWPDNPGGARSWPKGKTQRSACVRAAEGCRGRDVRPRSFGQTGNCVAVGPRRIGLSGRLLEPFEALATDGRG